MKRREASFVKVGVLVAPAVLLAALVAGVAFTQPGAATTGARLGWAAVLLLGVLMAVLAVSRRPWNAWLGGLGLLVGVLGGSALSSWI